MLARKLLMSLVVCSLVAFAASSALAQPPGGRGTGGTGFGGFGGGPIDLLQNASVQKELELLDDQLAQVRTLAETNRNNNSLREAFGQLRDLPEEQRRDRINELLTANREATQKEIDKILLPHQSERLRQIEYQVSMRRGGGIGISGRLAEELGITEQQQEELQAAAEKAMEEMRAAQAKLQEEARQKVLATLSPAQQAKYKELVGEPFDYVPEQPQFGGRDGGRGRTGGDAGGRGRPGGGDAGGRGRGRPGGENN
jgi:Spy/CpxP family protein refolding chaperone